jgi:uncharacterized membrane protein YoaK (UPF0700 family)
MFSAEAYSFRHQSRLAISLSWVGGFTNVIAYLACQTFASHMTGASTLIGLGVGRLDWLEFRFYFCLVGSFLAGSIASALMTEIAKRRGVASKYILPLTIEAFLLTVVALLLDFDFSHAGTPRLGILSVIAFSMGLQNATITKISGAVVRSTHLTGVVTDFGIESVKFGLWAWDKLRGRFWQRGGRLLRVSQRHPTALRLALLASIWGSFFFGAAVGAFLFSRFHAPSLCVPIGFLVLIIIQDWRKPIADIREIDLLSDPELKLHGIVHTLLPPELALYRLAHDRRMNVRAPNFGLWIERLPKRKQVIILVMSPVMKFSSNSILDLKAAVEHLEESGRRLIIAGVNPAQYKVLAHEHVLDRVGPENVCPDIEFAIALGTEMVRDERNAGSVG